MSEAKALALAFMVLTQFTHTAHRQAQEAPSTAWHPEQIEKEDCHSTQQLKRDRHEYT